MKTPLPPSTPSTQLGQVPADAAAAAASRSPVPAWIWPFAAAFAAIGVHVLLSVPRGPMEFVKPDESPPPTSNDDDELPRIPQRPTPK